ncbi:MAG: hypothetical protein WAV07_06145, partial [Candidatus Contendobacter sp.]
AERSGVRSISWFIRSLWNFILEKLTKLQKFLTNKRGGGRVSASTGRRISREGGNAAGFDGRCRLDPLVARREAPHGAIRDRSRFSSWLH